MTAISDQGSAAYPFGDFDRMNLVSELNALFLNKLNVRVLTPDTNLLESGLLDSMQIVELRMQIEQQFGLHIDLKGIDFDDFCSFARIARLIEASAPTTAIAG